MKQFLYILVFLLFPSFLWSQGYTPGRTAVMLRPGTTLPSTCTIGEVWFDTDATAGGNIYGCTAADTWTAQGSGGAELSENKGITGGYPGLELSAGAPAAGSCDGNGWVVVDTTNEDLYFCSDGAGGNPRLSHANSVAYTSVQGDSGSATPPAAGATVTFVGGTGLTSVAADGSPDTVTFNIDNHVKSIYFPAGALSTDGTQCAAPAEVTINSGPKTWTIICTDNDGSTIYGHVVMPDSWNAGTVTFELEYLQTAADTAVMNSDIAAMCRGAGETINNTWGSEIAIDDAAVSGSNIVDHTTSAAVTADGTCAAGDTLFFRWQLDATGTTTAVATLHILGVKMEYSVVGGGSD